MTESATPAGAGRRRGGGRGTGAIANALSRKGAQTKLVAMADVFKDRLDSSYNNTKRGFEKQVEVPEYLRSMGVHSAL